MREAGLAAGSPQPEVRARPLDPGRPTATASRNGRGGDVIEMVPQTAARPAGGALVPAESMPTEAEVEWRRPPAPAPAERHPPTSAVRRTHPPPSINVSTSPARI